MIIALIERFTALLYPPRPRSAAFAELRTLHAREQQPSDGRVFAWRRAALPKVDGSVRDPTPVILFDPLIGGPNKIVGVPRVLKPSEYLDDLDTLALRYPAPPIDEDA